MQALADAREDWRIQSKCDGVRQVDSRKLGAGITERQRKEWKLKEKNLEARMRKALTKFSMQLAGTVHGCTSKVCQLRGDHECSRLRGLLPEDVWRTWIIGRRNYGRKNPDFIISFLRAAGARTMNVSENRVNTYNYEGIRVCWICFCAMHGVNALSAEKVDWEWLDEGTPGAAVMATVQREGGQMNREIQQFIGEHYEFLAQWDPEGTRVTIPADVKFNVWHRWYGAYCKHHKVRQAHYAYFCAVWRMCFHHVKMTDKSKFSQCKECARMNHHLSRVGLTVEARFKRDLFAAKSAHVEYVRCIRRIIEYFWIHACHYPRALLFMNNDRMDALKTMIPRATRQEKNYEYEGKLGTSVHCSVTNIGDFYAISDKVMPKHCASCRQHIDMQTLQVVRRALGHELPKFVVIVEDNAKENKNHLRKFLWGMLVAWGVFDRVEFLFLIVGHTHGPVDRRFGRISTLICGRDVMTPSQLTTILCGLASEIGGPHAKQIRHFAWWTLSFPDMDSFWASMPELWGEVRKIPIQDPKRIIITRDGTSKRVMFETHLNVLRPTEIAKTYGRGFSGGNDNGRCGSIFSELLRRKDLSVQSKNCKSLMAFARWWTEKMMTAKPGKVWVVDFACTEEHKRTWWSARVIDKLKRGDLEKRLDTHQLWGDGSWRALLDLVTVRERFNCARCEQFSREDKDLRSSEGMCASVLGDEVHKEKKSLRQKHMESWASHRASEGHGGLPVWSLTGLHSMLVHAGTVLNDRHGFGLMQWTIHRDEEGKTDVNPWPSIRNTQEIPPHFLGPQWERHMPRELADEVNSHAHMLACSGYFEARWETLTRMNASLSVGDASFNQDIIRDAASYVNNIGVWNVFSDGRFTEQKCVSGFWGVCVCVCVCVTAGAYTQGVGN